MENLICREPIISRTFNGRSPFVKVLPDGICSFVRSGVDLVFHISPGQEGGVRFVHIGNFPDFGPGSVAEDRHALIKGGRGDRGKRP